MIEVVRYVEVTPTVFPPTSTPVAAVPTTAAEAFAAAASGLAIQDAPQAPVEAAQAAPESPVAEDHATENIAAEKTASGASCPTGSSHQYTSIPVMGARANHPDSQHGDLNLALRGYEPAEASLSLVDISGPTDGDAPQLAGVLGRAATIAGAYRARDWNWACGNLGCRGEVLGNVEVSLVALQGNPGEPVHVPTRGSEIYGGGFVALVLYADNSRLTVVYTREDSVANGYSVHLEDFCVDPNLLALYQANNAAGRGSLPAVRNGESVGTIRSGQVMVGVRDRGTFTDPRSRKDWWRGY
jgi:hypothetical protein